MLHQAYRAIKAVDQNAVVVMEGISQVGLGEKLFLGKLLNKSYNGQPCGNFFDVFNFHFYYNPGNPAMVLDGLEKIKHLRSLHGLLNKPIWITEVNRNKDHCTPLADAAQDQRKAFTLLLREGATKVFWFRDASTAEWKCGYPGILLKDSYAELQPLYEAYQAIAGISPVTPTPTLRPTATPTPRLPLSFNLSSNWNQISWPNIQGYTAKTVLEDINNDCGANIGQLITQKSQDFWEDYAVEYGGSNFDLQNNQNYFIKAGRECSWNP